MKEWLNNRIRLLSTPVGAIVAGVSLIIGMIIGKLIQQ